MQKNFGKMRNKTKFDISEIPYEKLETFGLTQEMVDDFPEQVMDRLLDGQRTPVIPFTIDGKQQKARISLARTEDGMDVLVMPYTSRVDMDGFNEEEQRTLRAGMALLSMKSGAETYYQLDDSTNQIISCPKSVIQHNMEILQRQMQMEPEKMEELSKSGVTTFARDKGEVTYTIDLTNENGIKMTRGNKYDADLYEERLPHYSFGIYGCWVNDDGGNLSYVNEDNYTQDMQDAQGEVIEKTKTGGMHR